MLTFWIRHFFTLADGVENGSLQSMLLAVKGMAGYTLWAVIAMIAILLFVVPWKKRQLRPEEIPDEV